MQLLQDFDLVPSYIGKVRLSSVWLFPYQKFKVLQSVNRTKNLKSVMDTTTLRVSSKRQAKIKMALQGCAGSGKTYSALLLAYGLTKDWSKVAVIDSENGSADLYANLGSYNVLPITDYLHIAPKGHQV